MTNLRRQPKNPRIAAALRVLRDPANARVMLSQHRIHGYWPHVDWNYVDAHLNRKLADANISSLS